MGSLKKGHFWEVRFSLTQEKTYSSYRWGFLHFRYLKCLMKNGSNWKVILFLWVVGANTKLHDSGFIFSLWFWRMSQKNNSGQKELALRLFQHCGGGPMWRPPPYLRWLGGSSWTASVGSAHDLFGITAPPTTSQAPWEARHAKYSA